MYSPHTPEVSSFVLEEISDGCGDARRVRISSAPRIRRLGKSKMRIFTLEPSQIVYQHTLEATKSAKSEEPPGGSSERLPPSIQQAMRRVRSTSDQLLALHEALIREVLRHQTVDEAPIWLTLKDAARRYRLAAKTLQNYVSDGKLRPGYHFSRQGGQNRGRLSFHVARMDQFMFEGHNGEPTGAVRRRRRRG